jgi:hypothetical protein
MDMPPAAVPPRPDLLGNKEARGKILMLKFYFNGSPNPTKVALFLEEAGIPYQPVPVDTRAGDQFKPEYLAVNPNGKVPAVDDDGVKVFDSNAILLYLAEKTVRCEHTTAPNCCPGDVRRRRQPFSAGVHFRHSRRRSQLRP